MLWRLDRIYKLGRATEDREISPDCEFFNLDRRVRFVPFSTFVFHSCLSRSRFPLSAQTVLLVILQLSSIELGNR